MLCQRCKKHPSVVDFVEQINGNKFEYHLCALCYAEYGGFVSAVLPNVLTGIFNTPAPRKKTCPVCNTSFSDFEKTGLLGCASCYDVFKDELMPTIFRIQGKAEHIGKQGKNLDEHGLHRQINSLKEQLEDALRAKNYREADRLSKQLIAISKTLYGGEDE